MNARPRVVVVGGGISGLATGYFVRSRCPGLDPAVTVVEAEQRWGGKVLTQRIAGLPVETGPDAFLARSVELRALVAELGLGAQITAPAIANSYIWSRDRLRPLPAGTMFGVPRQLLPVLRSGLLSPAGVARAGLDLVLPRRRAETADPSVGALLRPRFGAQLVDRLVETLLGGVHAGRVDQLSAASTVPDLAALARAERSLYLAMRRRTRAAGAPQPGAGASGMATLSGGLGGLIEALRSRLVGADLRAGTRVATLDRAGTGYRLGLADGTELIADAVVLATPAPAAADLLDVALPQAAADLRGIRYADVATVLLTYPRAAVRRVLDATGFLVSPREGRLLVGCTWLSVKWPQLRSAESVILRCQVGRVGDDRWLAMSAECLVDRVHAELTPMLDLAGRPNYARVQRWPGALPQYTVGHADRLERLDAAVGKLPGVHLTGAAYRGIGLPGCVTQALATARQVITELGATPTEPGE